jgi:endonuclease/exonuclease/phosphatase family metal-dependent hydrolase
MIRSQERLLLWNMGFRATDLDEAAERSRLDLLTAMVAERSPSIIALQEAPPREDLTRSLGSRYEIIEGPINITSAFLKLRWFAHDPREDTSGRSLGVKVDSMTRGSHLWVWNIHLPALWTEIGRRKEIVQCELLDQLRAARMDDQDRHELIVGDFNLFPYDEAFTLRSGLHANRSYDWVINTRLKGDMRRLLFNPTWQLLGRSQTPGGSFFRRDFTGGPWLVQDQAIMSAELGLPDEPQVDLVDRVRHADGTVTALCTTPDGAPDKKVGSDHLPLCVRFQAA